MSLTSWDDFPVHQAPEFIAHTGTSDRNFYDRYYFNMHAKSDEWFAIFGFGQYPNLGVVDAFIDVRRGPEQHVVRASKPLTDRSDLSVGPFRIEVLEPLHRIRVVVEPTAHSVAMDVTWEGHTPASTYGARERSSSTPSDWPRRAPGRAPSRSTGTISASPRTTTGATGIAPGASGRWASRSRVASVRGSWS